MAYTITHNFVSTILDGTSSAKVKPSNWSAPHTIAGSLHANEIINIPLGTITSTNVQNAINQLASLIPAVGPGTDPLFLQNGFNLGAGTFVEHSITSDPARVVYNQTKMFFNDELNDPGFTNCELITGWLVNLNADNTYGNTAGGNNQSKTTVVAGNFFNQSLGAGQKFTTIRRMEAFGMGDAFIDSMFMDYAGGPTPGDEGVGYTAISRLT